MTDQPFHADAAEAEAMRSPASIVAAAIPATIGAGVRTGNG